MKQQQIHNDIWLVVHTPKTAGTSLRWALEKHLGKSNIVQDYGPKSDVTSKVVREHIYSGDELKGPETLVAEISKEGKKILIGHFVLKKYVGSFDAKNIIGFVRDPLTRMCSEYLHRIKNGTLTGTFSEFVQKPGYQNLQMKFLDGISEESFVGVTEQYSESLQCINHRTHWSLATRKKNVGRSGGGRKFAENLSVQESELFYRMNAEDVEHYKSITQRFTTLGSGESTNVSFLNSKSGK